MRFPTFIVWLRCARFSALLKGVVIAWAAAAAHHVTLLFGAILFAIPVLWLAILDRDDATSRKTSAHRSAAFWTGGGISPCSRSAASLVVLVAILVSLLQNPINQMPIPHGSRDNYLLKPMSGINFWIIPMGAMILAMPFIILRGSAERRLRPLLFGWYLTTLLGLGGTTPVGKLLLGRAYQVLTFERFTFWATLMAMPFVGLLAFEMIAALAPEGGGGSGHCSQCSPSRCRWHGSPSIPSTARRSSSIR